MCSTIQQVVVTDHCATVCIGGWQVPHEGEFTLGVNNVCPDFPIYLSDQLIRLVRWLRYSLCCKDTRRAEGSLAVHRNEKAALENFISARHNETYFIISEDSASAAATEARVDKKRATEDQIHTSSSRNRSNGDSNSCDAADLLGATPASSSSSSSTPKGGWVPSTTVITTDNSNRRNGAPRRLRNKTLGGGYDKLDESVEAGGDVAQRDEEHGLTVRKDDHHSSTTGIRYTPYRDDGYSQLTPAEYIACRLVPANQELQRRLAAKARMRFLCQFCIFIATSVSVVLVSASAPYPRPYLWACFQFVQTSLPNSGCPDAACHALLVFFLLVHNRARLRSTCSLQLAPLQCPFSKGSSSSKS